jgi:hypothetical protein
MRALRARQRARGIREDRADVGFIMRHLVRAGDLRGAHRELTRLLRAPHLARRAASQPDTALFHILAGAHARRGDCAAIAALEPAMAACGLPTDEQRFWHAKLRALIVARRFAECDALLARMLAAAPSGMGTGTGTGTGTGAGAGSSRGARASGGTLTLLLQAALQTTTMTTTTTNSAVDSVSTASSSSTLSSAASSVPPSASSPTAAPPVHEASIAFAQRLLRDAPARLRCRPDAGHASMVVAAMCRGDRPHAMRQALEFLNEAQV